MLVETLKKECEKRNIKSATGLHEHMKRNIGAKYSYQLINRLWNGSGKIETLKDALNSIGITSVEYK